MLREFSVSFSLVTFYPVFLLAEVFFLFRDCRSMSSARIVCSSLSGFLRSPVVRVLLVVWVDSAGPLLHFVSHPINVGVSLLGWRWVQHFCSLFSLA